MPTFYKITTCKLLQSVSITQSRTSIARVTEAHKAAGCNHLHQRPGHQWGPLSWSRIPPPFTYKEQFSECISGTFSLLCCQFVLNLLFGYISIQAVSRGGYTAFREKLCWLCMSVNYNYHFFFCWLIIFSVRQIFHLGSSTSMVFFTKISAMREQNVTAKTLSIGQRSTQRLVSSAF